MLVIYEGPYLEGAEIGITGQVVPRGVPTEVDDEIGKSLCQQVGHWREHKESSKTEPAKGDRGGK